MIKFQGTPSNRFFSSSSSFLFFQPSVERSLRLSWIGRKPNLQQRASRLRQGFFKTAFPLNFPLKVDTFALNNTYWAILSRESQGWTWPKNEPKRKMSRACWHRRGQIHKHAVRVHEALLEDCGTVIPRYKGSKSNGNPPIMDTKS